MIQAMLYRQHGDGHKIRAFFQGAIYVYEVTWRSQAILRPLQANLGAARVFGCPGVVSSQEGANFEAKYIQAML